MVVAPSAGPPPGSLSPEVRVADLLFTLQRPPTRVALAGHLPGWANALDGLGIERVPLGANPGLVVTTRTELAAAAAAHRSEVLVVHGGGHGVSQTRPAVQQLFVRQGPVGPLFVVPSRSGHAVRYLLTAIHPPRGAVHRVRNPVVAGLVARGLGQRWFGATQMSDSYLLPFPIRAVEQVGLPPDIKWSLWFGDGDPYQRSVFHLFEHQRPEPTWVVKFGRVRGNRTPFERDERGLAMARSVASAARHAPTLLGRAQPGEYEVSIETAARGKPMNAYLTSKHPQHERLARVEQVADWIHDTAVASAQRGVSAGPESQYGSPSCWEAVSGVPRSIQHNDLGSWNIVVGPDDFWAVDWEAADRAGLPLWDLLYFLADALVLLDSTGSDDGDLRRTVELFRGERRLSHVLFERVRRLQMALGIDDRAVASMTELCWEHHSRSHETRGAPARLGRLWERWEQDSALKNGWWSQVLTR
ncbi:MAG: hypothetical protein NVS3B21_03170 [Acidimicrobiales bacterium]